MIVTAEPAGLPELARLMADSALLSRYETTYDAALSALEEALAGGDVILVARAECVLGFAWLTFAPRMLNGAAYLRLLLVTSPGNGVGGRLMSAAESISRERSARHLYLLVTTDNFRARHFYEGRGYRQVGQLPGLVRPELDEALYHKRLVMA